MTSSPVVLVGVGVGGLLLAGLLFRWLVRTTRQPAGQELIAVLFLGLLVLEASLYENPDSVPTGLFHPKVGSLSFRIFDLLVPLAIAARMLARPSGRRNPSQVPLWSAFLVWIALSAVEGVMGGNPKDFVAFEGKLIIYLGILVLFAAVPVRRWLDSRPLRRLIVASSALSGFLLLASEGGLRMNVALPLVPVQNFGQMGTDAATIFATLGVLTLAVGACSEKGRLRMVLIALPLLAAPVAAGQRAALVGLGVSLLVLLLACPFLGRNLRLTGAEFGLVVVAAVGILAAVVFVGGLSGAHVSLPFAKQIQETFSSRGKQLSGLDRLNQWSQATALIARRPWFGWGLGKTYVFYSPGFFAFMTTDLTHNIVLDLLLRTGIVGLLLFLAASIATVREFLISAVAEADTRLAGLAVACAAVFIGLLVKGMFESIFEKYRLALLMGILIGMSVSFARERLDVTAEAGAWPPQPLPVLSGSMSS